MNFEDDLNDIDQPMYDDYDDGVPNHNDLYKKLTNFDPYLQNLIMEWLGMYYDDNKKKFIRQAGVRPTMNIQGARWAITFLRTYTRDNNLLTNIGEKTFMYVMQDVVDTVWLNIGTRYKEFNIQDMGDIIAVSNTLIHATELVLTGAHGPVTYSDLFRGTYRRNDTGGREIMESQRAPPPKKGMIRRFFGV